MSNNTTTELTGWKKYCKEQNIEFSVQRILIDGLGGMAHGLFASLLIGTIFSTIGVYLFDFHYSVWGQEFALLVDSKTFAYAVQGAAMAGAIAYSMKAPPYVIYSCLAVGYATNSLGGAGGPLAVFFVTIIAVFLGKLVSKRTPVDLLVTPTVTIVGGVLIATLIAPPIGAAASWLGNIIMWATNQHPFLMGILVAAIMGIVLTLPISSAAICAAKGVDFLLPRKPSPPAEAQDRALPCVSVTVTIVLLKEERIWTWPRSMFFFSRRRRMTFLPPVAFAVAIFVLPPYFFLLAMVFLGPLRVLALVLLRWPRTGRPLR